MQEKTARYEKRSIRSTLLRTGRRFFIQHFCREYPTLVKVKYFYRNELNYDTLEYHFIIKNFFSSLIQPLW